MAPPLAAQAFFVRGMAFPENRFTLFRAMPLFVRGMAFPENRFTLFRAMP
jgi:hypothetical protein